jgi:prepilin-type N-terminal cleavage/methylation domain-containing protein
MVINKFNKKLIKPGFTLVEILVVVSLLGVALTLTTGILLSVIKTTRKQQIIRGIERNGDNALRLLEENTRKANSVTKDANGYLVMQAPNNDGTVVTRYMGYVSDVVNCQNNYIFMTEGDLSNKESLGNRITDSIDDNVKVSEFTVNLYNTERPTQLFVKITLQSCYDTSISKSFETFVTARGTYY